MKPRPKSCTIETAYKIERGIVLWTTVEFPFAEMAIGDSFRVPLDGKKIPSLRTIILAKARRSNCGKFTTRTDGDGIRVWRIA